MRCDATRASHLGTALGYSDLPQLPPVEDTVSGDGEGVMRRLRRTSNESRRSWLPSKSSAASKMCYKSSSKSRCAPGRTARVPLSLVAMLPPALLGAPRRLVGQGREVAGVRVPVRACEARDAFDSKRCGIVPRQGEAVALER